MVATPSIRLAGKTSPHSLKSRLLVTMVVACLLSDNYLVLAGVIIVAKHLGIAIQLQKRAVRGRGDSEATERT